MKRLPFAIAFMAMAIACAPRADPTSCPDGNQCYTLDCSGNTRAECLNAMGKVCPNGYDQLEEKYSDYYLIRCHSNKPASY